MMTKKERINHVYRLDGYLDALSLVNGNFRKSRYGAYLADIGNTGIEEQLKSIYLPYEATVTFGELETIPNWLRRLESELNNSLLGNLLGKSFDSERHLEKNRIHQAGWYVMEMIRVLTDDFQSSPIIYKCNITVSDTDTKPTSSGSLYIIPIRSEYLVLSLEW
ncbi:hypothetical protein [Chitinibacter sp. S2-10]|uniref:hypothetical protein n=1 Tax=Chitinibacter sp. S2-10 TaxID=3373597 RepID=UPI0039779EC0